MKIIKLTSLQDKQPIYINAECIGHFYEVSEKLSYGRVEKQKHTRIGVITHNNGFEFLCLLKLGETCILSLEEDISNEVIKNNDLNCWEIKYNYNENGFDFYFATRK